MEITPMARKSREQSTEQTRVIGYVRVSSEQQTDHGVSLQAQEEKIKQYCSLYELALVDIITDAGASAKTLQREGLQKALSILETGQADGIVVVKLDRLTRNVANLGTLITEYFNTYSLISVSEQVDTRSASGRLVLNVLTSVAQWEREAIGERTSLALQYKKAQGERVGTISMGKSLSLDGKCLVENTQEQQAITLAKQYRANGLSLRKIASKLAENNHFNRLGSMYNARSIAIMVGEV
jgi:DNA invertase Pin-like site-specific DNA recombinase